MALPVNGNTHLIPAYYSVYRPRKDERLSRPSWLTYSGWLTHISGHPSAAGRAQDRESSPARNRRSTTVPRHSMLLHSMSMYWATGAAEPIEIRCMAWILGFTKMSFIFFQVFNFRFCCAFRFSLPMVQTVCQTSNCCINYTRLDKIADLVKRMGKKLDLDLGFVL